MRLQFRLLRFTRPTDRELAPSRYQAFRSTITRPQESCTDNQRPVNKSVRRGEYSCACFAGSLPMWKKVVYVGMATNNAGFKRSYP